MTDMEWADLLRTQNQKSRFWSPSATRTSFDPSKYVQAEHIMHQTYDNWYKASRLVFFGFIHFMVVICYGITTRYCLPDATAQTSRAGRGCLQHHRACINTHNTNYHE